MESRDHFRKDGGNCVWNLPQRILKLFWKSIANEKENMQN